MQSMGPGAGQVGLLYGSADGRHTYTTLAGTSWGVANRFHNRDVTSAFEASTRK